MLKTIITIVQISTSDKGIKTICLTAKNEIGCVDKACVDIENKYDIFIYVPNVFTPENHDGLNDEFIVTSLNIENYDLKIFNRWGQMVFRSNDANKHWDGIDMENGQIQFSRYLLLYSYLQFQIPENPGSEWNLYFDQVSGKCLSEY